MKSPYTECKKFVPMGEFFKILQAPFVKGEDW
jgi:hypothetical protein